jgi:hypothetical protein
MEKVKQAAVYTLTINHGETSYIYVGSTKDIRARMTVHLRELEKGIHHSELLQKVYNETKRMPLLEILESPRSLDDRIESESSYIEYFKQFDGVVICNSYKPCIYSKRVYLKISDVRTVKMYLHMGVHPKVVSDITGVKVKQIHLIKGGFRWSKVTF